MKRIVTWGILLSLGLLYAHKEDTPNKKLLSWEKMEIIVTYDAETKTIHVKGHSHHVDGTRILVILKFAGEKFALESHSEVVKNKQFEHLFGPFEDLTLLPGHYEVSCWFVMEQQTKEIQRRLLESDFFHCSPPCRFDMQHYQMETVSVGTEEEITEAIKSSEARISKAVQTVKTDSFKALKIFKETVQEFQNVTDPSTIEGRIKSVYEELDNLHYSVREVEQDLMEHREEYVFIYYTAVYERLMTISPFLEVFKNAIKRSQNKKNLKTLNKMSEFSDNLEKELNLFEDLLKNNFVNEEPPPREGESHNKGK